MSWKIENKDPEGRFFLIVKDDPKDPVRLTGWATDSSLDIYADIRDHGRHTIMTAIDYVDRIDGGAKALVETLVAEEKHLEEWRYDISVHRVRRRNATRIMNRIRDGRAPR